MQIKFKHKSSGREGVIEYDEPNRKASIQYDGDSSAIKSFLNTVREFRVPESKRIDDFRIDRQKPTRSLQYMEMALCELYAETGFWILWETQK